jgi:hypothetical protein
VVIPAVTGPYDLGNVAVRAAIEVNPETAQVTTVSDPLPQIVEGIPLRLKTIRVNLDRPNFALNPTNCAHFAVNADIDGDEGTAVSRSSHYQVANCTGLAFAPKLTLGLGGSTRRTGTPALKAVLTTKPGEANIARAQVTLPHAEFLDNAHIKAPCTRVQFAAGTGNGAGCPPGTVIGYARADSPLLDGPLQGPVYLRSSSHRLPDLVAALGGQIQIDLDGRIDSVKGRLRSTFEAVPDVPVDKFTLMLNGGRTGLIVNSEDLCLHPTRARSVMLGQNGRRSVTKPTLQTSCGRSSRRKAG